MATVLFVFAGWPSWRTFRTPGYIGGRSAALLAHAEAPTTHIVQVDPDSARIARIRHSAVGGQLRTLVRLHLRFSGGLRTDAVYLVRPLRPQTEDPADLGLLNPDRGPVRVAARPLLQRAGVRVRGVQAVQLRAIHA